MDGNTAGRRWGATCGGSAARKLTAAARKWLEGEHGGEEVMVADEGVANGGDAARSLGGMRSWRCL